MVWARRVLGVPPLETMKFQPSSGTVGHKKCGEMLVFCSARTFRVVKGKDVLVVVCCGGWCARFCFLNWFLYEFLHTRCNDVFAFQWHSRPQEVFVICLWFALQGPQEKICYCFCLLWGVFDYVFLIGFGTGLAHRMLGVLPLRQ